jgi:hypothetical protein
MLTIVGIYIVSVILKWAYECIGWLQANKGKGGIKAWWADNSYDIMKKGITHIPLCIAWATGAALAAVNAGVSAVGLGAMDSVNPANTVMAAWFLDSFGKPWAAGIAKKADG